MEQQTKIKRVTLQLGAEPPWSSGCRAVQLVLAARSEGAASKILESVRSAVGSVDAAFNAVLRGENRPELPFAFFSAQLYPYQKAAQSLT